MHVLLSVGGLSIYLSNHLLTTSDPYPSILFSSPPPSSSISIQVTPPFLFPTSFLFTHLPTVLPYLTPCLLSCPTHLLFTPTLCVLLRRSNFPFDFGGNAFFTNQRGSQAAPTSSFSSSFFSPSLPPSLLVFSLPSLLFLPLSAPQAREEIKEPPSFPC